MFFFLLFIELKTLILRKVLSVNSLIYSYYAIQYFINKCSYMFNKNMLRAPANSKSKYFLSLTFYVQ